MSATADTPTRERLLRIGEVVRRLGEEFPDISISKIRYLEDEGLLTPQRTRGGYRLFAEEDVERLHTILRLQRDEFLPLRVIREELDAPGPKERKRRKPSTLGSPVETLTFDELCERSGLDAQRVRELEEYGLLEPHLDGGRRLYSETDVEIAAACDTLARYGIAARHLRAFRTAADRESGLLEALVAPALRSRNADRRRAGMDDLQRLAETAQELSQLLFARNVRRLADA